MNLQCIICMEIYTSEDEVIITPCGHLFHNLCLQNWHQRQLNCAQCRTDCSSLDLKRVFFNSASDNEVHLIRNCNAEAFSIELEQMRSNLSTVQEDLHNSNSEIVELKTIIASLEDLKLKSVEIEQLQKQLDMAIGNLENSEKELESSKAEIAELKTIALSINETTSTILCPGKIGDKSTSLEKELELVKLQKQIIENELKKAKEEIAQMKNITQALALRNLSIFNSNDSQNPSTCQNNDKGNNKNESTRNNNTRFNINVSQNPRTCNNNDKRNNKNELTRTRNSENISEQPLDRQQNNKSRTRHRINKNLRGDKSRSSNDNMNNTKPKEKENEHEGTNMASMDKPWW